MSEKKYCLTCDEFYEGGHKCKTADVASPAKELYFAIIAVRNAAYMADRTGKKLSLTNIRDITDEYIEKYKGDL